MENENKETSIQNFSPNVLAAFSYLVPPLTGIVFFLVEQKNKFVRFHALQSILFGAASYALWVVAGSLRFILIGYFLQQILGLLLFGAWLYLMWQAYQNVEYEIPYLGRIAKEQINK